MSRITTSGKIIKKKVFEDLSMQNKDSFLKKYPLTILIWKNSTTKISNM